MTREGHVRFRESVGVRLPRATRPYGRVKGQGKYVYRAVDKEGQTVEFLLTPTRDRDAAEAFLRKAIRTQGLPEKLTSDQRGSNTAALTHYTKTPQTAIVIRQCKYLNNVIEQDHRTVKKRVWLAKGYGSFQSAWRTLQGIETVHMSRKGRVRFVS